MSLAFTPRTGVETGPAGSDDSAARGIEQRAWARHRPTGAHPCRVTVRGLGPGVAVGQVPRDVSLGGCQLVWERLPPAPGVRCTAEVLVPGAVLLLDAVVVHVGSRGAGRGVFGLRFLPGAAMEAAWVPLGAYLALLQPASSPAGPAGGGVG